MNGDAPRARAYLKETGITATPDRLKEILGLRTSAATLGRKLRAASVGENPELLRTYYTNEQGRSIAQYEANPDYGKEHPGDKIDRIYDEVRDGIVDLTK